MKRERLLRRPGKDKKLSFECPEVMHEEKSALHFIIIEQEAPEVGRHWSPYICMGRLFDAEIMQFSLFDFRVYSIFIVTC